MRLPSSTLGRIGAAVGAAILLLLVLTQLFLAGLGEGAIEDRLTEHGGVADVSLTAFPAARLLWGDGDRLAINATGLDLDLDPEDDPVVFDDLDRFSEVEIVISDSRVGPVQIGSFILLREGDGAYSLDSTGSTSVADVAEYLADDADVPGSGIVGTVLDFTGVGGADLDLVLDMRLTSEDGRIRVTEGGGEFAGIPTGPLAELITQAIVVQL